MVINHALYKEYKSLQSYLDIAHSIKNMDNLYQVCEFDEVLIDNSSNVTLTVKRIDTVHPTISGNKYYKLKHNLHFAKEQGFTQILSFGGAYSNHIHALAHACHEFGFGSVGIIRGDELANRPLNKTLTTAKNLGMDLHFITRQEYRNKSNPECIANLKNQFPNAYLIPEGGTNELAILGTQEILTDYDRNNFDVICCAVGTGGTISGIINSASQHQLVIGFSALKSNYQIDSIETWTNTQSLNKIGQSEICCDNITIVDGNSVHNHDRDNLKKSQSAKWGVLQDEEFGGYGRFNEPLINFIDDFNTKYDIPLEPLYTGKAMYYLCQSIQNSESSMAKLLRTKRILFIHTGGLQVTL